MVDIFNSYTTFLMNKVSMSDSVRYVFLLTELNKIEFYYVMETDADRARDGLRLRQEFINAVNDDSILRIMPGSCTALELLVGMAERADDIMYDPEVGPRPEQWFWLFIHNLGLDYLTDDQWSFDASNFIFVVMSKWFDRRFSPKGVGSPYPNPLSRSDLSQVPIWDALNWYLADNYENM